MFLFIFSQVNFFLWIHFEWYSHFIGHTVDAVLYKIVSECSAKTCYYSLYYYYLIFQFRHRSLHYNCTMVHRFTFDDTKQQLLIFYLILGKMWMEIIYFWNLKYFFTIYKWRFISWHVSDMNILELNSYHPNNVITIQRIQFIWTNSDTTIKGTYYSWATHVQCLYHCLLILSNTSQKGKIHPQEKPPIWKAFPWERLSEGKASWKRSF